MFVAVLVLITFLAAMNGSNDVSKGVATLAGAGVTRYRTAIAWGTVTTALGCLFSLTVADRLTKLFSSGIVTQVPSDSFTVAVLTATGAWVAFATFTSLPVSTTQALVGGLVGAGTLLGSGAVAWSALPAKILLPSVLAIGLAYAVSFTLSLIPRRVPECICVTRALPETAITNDGGLAFSGPASTVHVTAGTLDECRVHAAHTGRLRLSIDGAHWFSSGSVGFARGLNDTPKLVAIGALTLVPGGMTITEVLLLVTGAMAVGSLLAGRRVTQRLGGDVLDLDHAEGAKANFTTAGLVGAAAFGGIPLSTTQVSASAIAGASGTHPSRLHRRTLRDFAIAWLATPVSTAAVAAAVFAIIR